MLDLAELCDILAREFNIRVVLTGQREDLKFANQIMRLTKSKPITAVGKTDIMELASLIKHFKVYLTPDSAPMHIAASVGVPFVALFGPTDPLRHLPPSKDYIVLYKGADVKCAPCYSPHCMKNYRCMKKITVDDAFGAIKKFLQRGEGK